MKYSSFLPGCLALGFALAALPAFAATDSGAAGKTPWSGYWWQHRTGGLTGPLKKYDTIYKTNCAAWEQTNHVEPAMADPNSSWYGYCHAWSAASCTEKEPTQVRNIDGVSFGIGDQKGLLAACHASDQANSWGDRFGDGRGSEDRNDMLPCVLWRLLQLHIGQRQIPIVLDLDEESAVWNYPCYQYRVDYNVGAGGVANCVMYLLVADDNVRPDFLGTDQMLRHYTFHCKMENGAVVEGSGQWTGQSASDHPDFAWYPYVAVAETPGIAIDKVARIIGGPVGGENPLPEPTPMTTPPNTNPPNTTNPPVTTNPPNTTNPPTETTTNTNRPPSPPDPNVSPDTNRPLVNVPPPAVDTSEVTPHVPVNFDGILTPEELVLLVANKTSHFMLDASVKGGDGAKYAAGDPIPVFAACQDDGFAYVFDVDPCGDLRLLFPLNGEDNRLTGVKDMKDSLWKMPLLNGKERLVASGHGQHDLKVVVLKKPISLSGFSSQSPQHQVPSKVDPKVPSKVDPAVPSKTPPPVVQYEQPKQLTMYPAAQKRVRGRLLGFFRGKAVEEPAPITLKVGNKFAQDACAYYVTDPQNKLDCDGTTEPAPLKPKTIPAPGK